MKNINKYRHPNINNKHMNDISIKGEPPFSEYKKDILDLVERSTKYCNTHNIKNINLALEHDPELKRLFKEYDRLFK